MDFKHLAIGAILALSTTSAACMANEDGPGSSGGGNSINGMLIESYVTPADEIEGYKEFFLPLMNELEQEVPGLAKILKLQAHNLNWYLVPRDIKTLSDKLTGLPFSSDQIATQNRGEVFIDKDSFLNLADIRNRGVLILHEAVLGHLISNQPNGVLTKENAAFWMSGTRTMTSAILKKEFKNNPKQFHLSILKMYRGANYDGQDRLQSYLSKTDRLEVINFAKDALLGMQQICLNKKTYKTYNDVRLALRSSIIGSESISKISLNKNSWRLHFNLTEAHGNALWVTLDNDLPTFESSITPLSLDTLFSVKYHDDIFEGDYVYISDKNSSIDAARAKINAERLSELCTKVDTALKNNF